MHINDIKAISNKVALDESFHGKMVVIRSPKDMGGKYLSRSGLFDAGAKQDAVRYRYTEDKVGDQVMACYQQGMLIEVESV